MYVVVTIPAYNEEKTIAAVVAEVQYALKKTHYKYKVLVVDDGSTDATAKIAQDAGAVVVKKRHSGLLETFKREMEECARLKADVIVHTDADGQYPAQFIPELLHEIERGADIVLGSRFSGMGIQMPLIKKIGNRAFAYVLSRLCHTNITDSTTGFRAFTREVAQELSYSTGFTYTHEQLIRAARLGFKIVEIPIETRKTRASRLMKGPFDYAVKAWINLFRIYRDYQPLAFFGKVGLLFILCGVLLSMYITYSFLVTGLVGGLPRVVLATLMILTGIQIVLFGFLADMRR